MLNTSEWNFTKNSKLVILTGSGISVDSGIPAYRIGKNATWLNYPVEIIGNPNGLKYYRDEFIEFYNKARRLSTKSSPNEVHKIITDIQNKYNAFLITQNVDDLHEKSGSRQVCHVHGTLYELACEGDERHEYEHLDD